MENNTVQDHTKWKLPKGAKARLGKSFVYDLVYSPDSKLLATSGPMGIWIYDAQTGVELNLLTGHTDGVSAVAFSPDNNLSAIWNIPQMDGHSQLLGTMVRCCCGMYHNNGIYGKMAETTSDTRIYTVESREYENQQWKL